MENTDTIKLSKKGGDDILEHRSLRTRTNYRIVGGDFSAQE